MEKKENARVEESLNLEMLLLCVMPGLIKVWDEVEFYNREKRFGKWARKL